MTHLSHPHPEAERARALIQHYGSVRARLFNGPPPPPEAPRKLIQVQPQPHRPDYVQPSAPLPYVIFTEKTAKRIRDILVIAQETRDFIPEPGHWKDIVDEVCAKHGVTRSEIMGIRRAMKLVAARQEAMYRMSRETSFSLPQIGKRLGGRDHTTVLHGIRRHEAVLHGQVYRQPRYGKALGAASL